MTWLWRALPKSLRARSERIACPAGIILEPGKTGIAQQLIEGICARYGKREKSPEACPKSSRGKVQLADIRNRSKFRADTRWSLLIAAPRKPSEALLLEDQRDGGGLSWLPPCCRLWLMS